MEQARSGSPVICLIRKQIAILRTADGFTMIARKGDPSLCRLDVSRCLPHPAQHSSLRDIESEHLQLSMNARRTTGLALGYHAEDMLAQFPVDALAPVRVRCRERQAQYNLKPALCQRTTVSG
jgi:hypothetical protein